MRIAYVTETYAPEVNGVALTAERAVRHLRQAGHVVQLVRPRQGAEVPLDTAEEWRCAGGPIPLYPDLRFGWASATALRRRWRAFRADLVHVATPGPLGWSALRAAQSEGMATSAEFRTNFHAYAAHYRLGWIEPLVLSYLRRLHAMAAINFVPTAALAQALTAHGFHGLQVVGRGVDSRLFSPQRRDAALRTSWGAAEGDTVLLHVGRLAAEKNVGLALQGFERLRSRTPGLRMVVVGDGPMRARLQAEHPNAHFAGLQHGEALARCYASADVFLFPSLTDTFGNVTLEALASGLALVAFDTAAAAVWVNSGVNGCLAEGTTDADFLAALAQALPMAAPGSALREAARRTALRSDWDSVLRGFEQRLLALATSETRQPGQHALA